MGELTGRGAPPPCATPVGLSLARALQREAPVLSLLNEKYWSCVTCRLPAGLSARHPSRSCSFCRAGLWEAAGQGRARYRTARVSSSCGALDGSFRAEVVKALYLAASLPLPAVLASPPPTNSSVGDVPVPWQGGQ
ncbi:hypothetical protein NDU88_001557 [Pleurodeles waltl]|uniref:Uncharacterized protein n=1 Tax=Pleurodeles waltl TaxID=8319 RepID=A0AAV7NCY7_PLEWA|nr:hypothetical protein NDU88_001557 [Pleurodeles waltl]